MRQTTEISELIEIIGKRKWITIVMVILAVGAGLAYGYWRWTPTYRADTVLMVSSARTPDEAGLVDFGTVSMNQMLAVTYGEIVKSRSVLERVIDDLNLNTSYEGLSARTSSTTIPSTELIRISVDSKSSQEAIAIADRIAEVFEEEIGSIQSLSSVRIIDRAAVRRDPVNMGRIRIVAILGVAGFVFGIVLTLIADYRDKTIKTPEDLERYIGVNSIGDIPDFGRDKGLVLKENPRSPIAESYRSIRTNIQFANIDGDVRTILFTSSNKSEGKTSTISNIALTMADAGHRVILIDCDFRNSSIHKAFNITNKYGVTDILLKEEEYGKHIHRVGANKNLDVLTAGQSPSNPSELLYSKSMKKFIDRLGEDYEYILVDTPPVTPVTDATVMSTYIDGVILVCSAGRTEIDSLRKTVEALRKVESNIIGVILNKTPSKGKKSYYYYSGEI